MSSSEFEEWQAYCRIEPFGGDIDDARFGVLAAMFANYARDPKKTQPFKPENFFFSEPMKKRLDKPQTADEQIAIVRALQEEFRKKE